MAAPRVTIDQLPEQTVATVTDLFVVQNGPTTKKMLVSKITDSISATVNTHINDTVDAHDATAISAAPGTVLTGGDVQTQLGQADTGIAANGTGLNNHVGAVGGAHAASAISVVAIAGVIGVDVQAVLAELAARITALETP